MAYQPAAPTNFKYRPHLDIAGVGALAFAGSMVLLLGLLNLFSAASNIVAQVMFISELPGLAIVLIGVDLMVIHALTAYGGGGRPLSQYYL